MARAPILALALALGACAPAEGPVGDDPGSGLRGRVVVAPTCPVETEGSPCAPRAVATTVTIESAEGDVRRVETEADGGFSVVLPPGRYQVSAQPPPGTMFVPRTISVLLEAGRYRRVTVVLDSRLREPGG
jgi:hypothetical protein